MASRSINLTLTREACEALVALATEDAATLHTNPERQKTGTVASLIFAERDRRAAKAEQRAAAALARAQKKNATT